MKYFYCKITEWEFSWKKACAVVLANRKKCVFGHLFGYYKATFKPKTRGNLHHPMFVTELLLVWTVGHMDPHITVWVIKPAHVPSEFELKTYQFECGALAYRAIRNTINYMWQSNYERCFKNLQKGRVILKLRRPPDVVFTACELEPACTSSNTFSFWFRTLFI